MIETSGTPEEQQNDFFNQYVQLLDEIEKSLAEDIQDLNEIKPLLEAIANEKRLPNLIEKIRGKLTGNSLSSIIQKVNDAKEWVSDLRVKLPKEVGEREEKVVKDLLAKRRSLTREQAEARESETPSRG